MGEKLSDARRSALLRKIATAQAKTDQHLVLADTWKNTRYRLVVEAKEGGVINRDIADALGMTVAGVVKLVERGRQADG